MKRLSFHELAQMAARLFALVLISAIVAINSTCADASESATAQRPSNILFAFADDLGKYASAYRDPDRPSPNDIISTPVFDRVAREGALFHNAFVSAPSCTPSRAAIVSGRHFFRNGSHSQLHHPWMQGYTDPFDDVRGFPLMLQSQSFHIGWTYKMHIFEDRMGGSERNYRSAGSQFNGFSARVTKAKDAAVEKARLLEEVRQNFRSFLADRQDDQPFYYWFNPTNTHRPWARGSGKSIWGLDPDQLRGKLPKFLPDNEVVREDFADYLGEAMAFDAAVGVLIEELERIGELDNTLVVISGDHGAPGFPRGKCNLYDFGTQVLLAARMPGKIVAGREIDKPVSLIDLASTYLEVAGLAATEDMNGQSLWSAMTSGEEDYEQDLRGFAITGRETHVDVAREAGYPYPMRGIRTKDHLYVINFKPERWPVAVPPLAAPLQRLSDMRQDSNGDLVRRTDIDFGPTRDYFFSHEDDPQLAPLWQLGLGLRPAEELYVVASDPDQMQNRADDPELADVKAQLREQLMDELKRNGDPRVVGTGDGFDRAPYRKPVPPDTGLPVEP